MGSISLNKILIPIGYQYEQIKMKYMTSYQIVNLTVSLIHQAKDNNNELGSLPINR